MKEILILCVVAAFPVGVLVAVLCTWRKNNMIEKARKGVYDLFNYHYLVPMEFPNAVLEPMTDEDRAYLTKAHALLKKEGKLGMLRQELKMWLDTMVGLDDGYVSYT